MSAIVHYVRSQYYKQQRDFAEFYMSSLLYLAFISMDSLPEDQKLVRFSSSIASVPAFAGQPCHRGMHLVPPGWDSFLIYFRARLPMHN